jgi:hypothetical protein
MLQCSRCLAVHGPPGCPATHTDVDGKPSCTWCEDGASCPVVQKQQRDARRRPPEEPTGKTSEVVHSEKTNEQESGVKAMSTPETATKNAPLICNRPGCETQLSPRNSVGLCQRHVRWTAPKETASSPAPTNGHAHAPGVGSGGNGHAAAGSNGANGSATKKNGNAASPANGNNGAAAVLPALAADRVDHLIANLTAADKAKIAFAWLKGEL